jgi:hypothetical protein
VRRSTYGLAAGLVAAGRGTGCKIVDLTTSLVDRKRPALFWGCKQNSLWSPCRLRTPNSRRLAPKNTEYFGGCALRHRLPQYLINLAISALWNRISTGSDTWRVNMIRNLAAVLPVAALFLMQSSATHAVGTVYSGSADCDALILVIDGLNGPVSVPREQDAYVPVDPPIKYHCGSGTSQINECPRQTNQFHVHRQKADNKQWLYDCQVTP